jgi:hypothetical protein
MWNFVPTTILFLTYLVLGKINDGKYPYMWQFTH